MVPPDINALRAVSDRPMKTRWKPVDLACGHLREEVTVRTKLARSDESMAVCIAEAVSHALLLANGFRMAEPFCVVIGEQFAQDLTTQYRFAEPVRPGRHWGTRLMRRGVQEVELTASLVEVLAPPPWFSFDSSSPMSSWGTRIARPTETCSWQTHRNAEATSTLSLSTRVRRSSTLRPCLIHGHYATVATKWGPRSQKVWKVWSWTGGPCSSNGALLGRRLCTPMCGGT